MNKKYFIILITALYSLSNCIALDTAGFAYKGSEAKKIIEDAAFEGDLVYGIFQINGGQNVAVDVSPAIAYAITDKILVEITSKIEDSKYYSKTDVTNCADDIRNYAYLLISNAFYTTFLSGHCANLKSHGLITK